MQKSLPEFSARVDWSVIRLICIAPNYKKYDIHAAQMIGENIELWQYRFYENGALFFEEIYKKTLLSHSQPTVVTNKNPVMVEAGRKAAYSRAHEIYGFEQHYNRLNNDKKFLLKVIRGYILNLDESVEEVVRKYTISYKISQNFTCIEVFKNKIVLYLKIDISSLSNLPPSCEDVSNTSHRGTGDLKMVIYNENDFIIAKDLIKLAFLNIGGN